MKNNQDKKKQDSDLTEEELQENKEEFEKIIEALKELEEVKKSVKSQRRPRNLIAIEFGGVFHRNIYVDFLFNFILNLTVSFIIIEIFDFAKYNDINYVIYFVLSYTLIEMLYKSYLLANHFTLIIKSLGFIFFFGYVFIFYLLDIYIFDHQFTFHNEILLIVFVSLFTIIRYIIGTMIRQNFRNRNLR